jgi:phosphate-selective porin OprO and OprP
MYFLTGENRNYNRERANWERVVPYEDWVRMPGEYGRACGRGAWQVGVRYSYVDLNCDKVYGGQENEVTFGLNWFLNPNLKFQWNYDATYRDNEVSSGNSASNGWINGFGTRMCLDF